MQIILLERVGKLGAMGDTVTVKDGYARNFLLPQGKALRANKANMAIFESRREELEKRNAEMKLGAEDAAKAIDGKSYVVIRSAGEAGQLYGSVSTRDIAALCRQADILVAAVGRPHFVQADWVKPGATVIDVGINRIEEAGKSRLVGDVDFDAVQDVAAAITPVPGGVGPMTIACLMHNTVTAARKQHGLD